MTQSISRQIRIVHISGVSAGRLVVYAPNGRTGTITIYLLAFFVQQGQAYYAELRPYTTGDDEKVKAAVFSPLLPANYRVIEPGCTTIGRNVTVFPGETAEVDFR